MEPVNLNRVMHCLRAGDCKEAVKAANGDLGILRPWVHDDGSSYITLNVGTPEKPNYKNFVTNTPASLRREDWLAVDRDVQWQVKDVLKYWEDVRQTVPKRIPNAMGRLAVQHYIGDFEADATLSMDPIRTSERSRQDVDAVFTPLPVWHSDGNFSHRQLMVAETSRLPLDSTSIAASSRKIAEQLEDFGIGTQLDFPNGYTAFGGTTYGLLNFPYRNTYTITSPEAGGWTPKVMVDQILQMIQVLVNFKYGGPYKIYYSKAWAPYFEGDYSTQYSSDTLRSRLNKVTSISSMMQLDRLPGFKIIVIQMTPNVVEGLLGEEVTTVQWTEMGGMEWHYRVLTIQVQRLRHDSNGHTGYIVGTATDPTTTTTTTTTT